MASLFFKLQYNSQNKMLSQAGRSYNKTRVVSPYSTRQRFRYYQLDLISSPRKEPKQYQTLDTNLRDKQDSYILRYAKDIVTTTNHFPSHNTILTTSPRQPFNKASFTRIIGDIKDQDYSVPLTDNCDHRCAKANDIELEKMVSTSSSRKMSSGKLNDSELETASMEKNDRLNSEIFNSQMQSLDLSKKLQRSDLKSTEPSLLKKRSKMTIDVSQKNLKSLKPRRLKGLSFDSSAGHRYLKEIQDKDQTPEFYNIQQSNESLIKKSFKEPRINVNFASFRNSIATRYDRADPNWHLSLDTSNQQILKKDLSYNFESYSSRQINEVKSKYPHRGNMNLYHFGLKETQI